MAAAIRSRWWSSPTRAIIRRMTRRAALKLTGATALMAAPPASGRLKQSVARWCYAKMPLEELCRHGAEMGLAGIDLVNDPEEWPTVRKYGLVPLVSPGAGTIPSAWNRKENHTHLEKEMRENLARAASAKLPNVITFSGNRGGISD